MSDEIREDIHIEDMLSDEIAELLDVSEEEAQAILSFVKKVGGLDKAVLDPRDVFEDRAGGVPVGQVHVHLAHVAGVRRDRQAVGMRQVGDADGLGEAARRVTSGCTQCIAPCAMNSANASCV